MIKRYTLKLGAGLISLMAMGVGCGHAMAQSHAQPSSPAPSGGRMTGTQLAFELAMAQSGAAQVQNAAPRPTKAAAPERTETVPGTDGLTKGAAYIEADEVTTGEDGVVTARGAVQMRQNGRITRADTVSSNSKTGVTEARGNAQTINEDGSVQFADYITYDDNNQAGYSENFASISKNNAKVFARRVEQISPDVNRLTNVIYTPCRLCVKNGETQDPTWSIEAGQITQRKDKKMVYYNNATVKIKGVPVFYAPYMWTPDPELERASGFLPPKIGTGKKRGFSYEQPFLWSISRYQYLIISPQLNSSVNPLINLEYERHFFSGKLHARFGFTNEAFFDNRGDRHGAAATRDYLMADGRFKINEDWRWSFTAQHVKDESGDRDRDYANFFERYNVDGAFEKVGDLSITSRQLINQFNLTRQVSNAYFAVNFANFQSLRAEYDDDDTDRLLPYAISSDFYPTIAPQIEAYWSPRARILGGQLTVSANGIGVFHKRLSTDLSTGLTATQIGAPTGLVNRSSGYDTMRASAGLTWTGSLTTRNGLRWAPFIDLRHDYYKVSNLSTNGLEADASRDLATAGVTLSYPMFRRFKSFTAIVEPIAQLAVSPDAQVSPYIPTEDSQSFEFDETTLFTFNKSPGFDIYEAGSRLNLGLRGEMRFDSGFEFEGLVGRVLRDEAETQFLRTRSSDGQTYYYDPSGLGTKNSDWIATGSFKTPYDIYGYTRLRFDSETSKMSQGEFGLSVKRERTTGTFRYIFNDLLTTPRIQDGKLVRFGDNYRNAQIYARHFFTDHWGVSARLDRDLVDKTWRRSTVSLIYRDDCSWFELVYQRNDTQLARNRNKPSSTIFLRLNLTTLGTSPSNFNDVR